MVNWSHLFISLPSITFGKISSIIQEKDIEDIYYRNLYSIARKYYHKTKNIPTEPDWDTLLELLPKDQYKDIDNYNEVVKKIYQVQPAQPDFFLEVLLKEVKEQKMAKELEKVINKMESGILDISDTIDKFKEIEKLKMEEREYIDVKEDVDQVLQRIRDYGKDKITTGLPQLDDITGGFLRKELGVIIAPPGRGKTTFLLNHCYYASFFHNTLLITLELDKMAMYDRYVRRITGNTRKEIKVNEEKTKQKVHRFFNRTHHKTLIHYEPAQTFSVNDLDRLLDKLEFEEGFTPDLVVIDYLKEMKPRSSDRNQNFRIQLSNICEDLRVVSIQRNISILTAMQTTRESLNKKIITVEDIGESFGIVHVAGIILALCQTKEEYDANQGRYFIAKNRDDSQFQQIPLFIDFRTMAVTGLDIDTVTPKTTEEKITGVQL